ncbi:MAG: hypothetical protein M1510_12300 [Nitrospirae bacterium]|nr:hypothetical protein [Nitrospirota bacterium]
MDERDRGLMEEFRRRLLPDLAGHLRRLVVFDLLFLHAAGTVPVLRLRCAASVNRDSPLRLRVRGEAAEDSDLDVIALVDEKTPEIVKEGVSV